MASTNYPKTIDTDNFANGKVDAGRLSYDIEHYIDEEQSSLTIVLEAIEIDGTTCNIWFKAPLSTEEEAMLTAICLAHTGEPLPADITAVTLEPTGNSLKNLQAFVMDFEADLNADTEYLLGFDEERYIQGVYLEVANHTYGLDQDKIEISIVAPNGAGGWVVVRAFVQGPDGTMAAIPPSGTTQVIAEGTALMPTFLRIRVTYHSVATSGNKPYVHLILRTWM